MEDFCEKNKKFKSELFYVACTRAKIRLYIVNAKYNIGFSTEKL